MYQKSTFKVFLAYYEMKQIAEKNTGQKSYKRARSNDTDGETVATNEQQIACLNIL